MGDASASYGCAKYLEMTLLGIAMLLVVVYQQTEAQSDCSTKLVEGVSNDMMTASSYYDNHSKPYRARLSAVPVPGGVHGAWSAGKNNQYQWIQADFNVTKKIVGVVTKGRDAISDSGTIQWVKTFKVLYSDDGQAWETVKGESGDAMVFNGNTDQNTEVTNNLPQPISARFLRIKPLTWHAYMSMRFDVIGCECSGMLVEGVSNDMMTASSYYDNHSKPYRARLSAVKIPGGLHGAWSAKKNNQQQWIQSDFGVAKKIFGVVTKGRNGISDSGTKQWVKTFNVLYSNDGLVWETVKDADDNDLVFIGNTDQDTPVTNMLPQPLNARFLRIKPLTWHRYMSIRFDVIGC
ncbi:hypothetical protein ScPMuIL_001523 [Solemya velum]